MQYYLVLEQGETFLLTLGNAAGASVGLLGSVPSILVVQIQAALIAAGFPGMGVGYQDTTVPMLPSIGQAWPSQFTASLGPHLHWKTGTTSLFSGWHMPYGMFVTTLSWRKEVVSAEGCIRIESLIFFSSLLYSIFRTFVSSSMQNDMKFCITFTCTP